MYLAALIVSNFNSSRDDKNFNGHQLNGISMIKYGREYK